MSQPNTNLSSDQSIPNHQSSQSNPYHGYAPAGVPSLGGYNISLEPAHVPLAQSHPSTQETSGDNSYTEQHSFNSGLDGPVSDDQWAPDYSQLSYSFPETQGQHLGHYSPSSGHPTSRYLNQQPVYATARGYDQTNFAPTGYQPATSIAVPKAAPGTQSALPPNVHGTLRDDMYQGGALGPHRNQFGAVSAGYFGDDQSVRPVDTREGSRYTNRFLSTSDNGEQEIPIDPQLTQPNNMAFSANVLLGNEATNLVAQPSLASGTEHQQTGPSDTQAASLPAQADHTRKRQRASETDEPDMPATKKKKTNSGSSQPEEVTKKTHKPRKLRPLGSKTKPKKYSELEAAIISDVPDYANVTLSYFTRDDAVSDFEARVKQLATYWTPPENDPSIPRTDGQRRTIVRQLLGAMKDNSVAKDKKSDSRWKQDASRKYDDRDLEAACWEVANLAERLHTDGPSVLRIHDVNYLELVKFSEDLTFEQRIRYIMVLMREYKSRADGLIKGQTLHTTIGAPQEMLLQARQNGKNNKKKARQIEEGRKALGLSVRTRDDDDDGGEVQTPLAHNQVEGDDVFDLDQIFPPLANIATLNNGLGTNQAQHMQPRPAEEG